MLMEVIAYRIPAEQQFATAATDPYNYSYDQGADTFGLLRRPTGNLLIMLLISGQNAYHLLLMAV